MRLAPGQRAALIISARHFWNRTTLTLEAQQPYQFHVPPDQHWRDLTIVCGPEGYAGSAQQQLANHWRRAPHLPWFSLVGTIDEEQPFLIGSGLMQFTPSVAGQLMCFANDVPTFYWNNFGQIQLLVMALPRA